MGTKEDKYLHKDNAKVKRRAKRHQERRCRDARKRVGGCIFVLGFPLILAGSIILIVSHTSKNPQSLPQSLFIVGPILTGLSAACFLFGALLAEIINVNPIINCLNPGNFSACPFFTKFFAHNHQSHVDKEAAILSLQTVPQKSALRKPPNPDVEAQQKSQRGVRFSSGSQSSLLMDNILDQSLNMKDSTERLSTSSIRNCKVYPKDEKSDAIFTVAKHSSLEDNVFYHDDHVV